MHAAVPALRSGVDGATIWLFRPASRPAALLLIPYWLWVTFATALNFAVWHAN